MNLQRFKSGDKFFAVDYFDITEYIFKDYELDWDTIYLTTKCGASFTNDWNFYATRKEAEDRVIDQIKLTEIAIEKSQKEISKAKTRLNLT